MKGKDVGIDPQSLLTSKSTTETYDTLCDLLRAHKIPVSETGICSL
jgi:indole-3-glycerol phosphate synthase